MFRAGFDASLGGTFSLPRSVRIFLAAGPADLRKSFNGLEAAARGELGLDPLSGHVVVFCNRRRNRIKILLFDGSGLWVPAKLVLHEIARVEYACRPCEAHVVVAAAPRRPIPRSDVGRGLPAHVLVSN